MVCCFAEDPSREFHRARLVWSAAIDPSVIAVRTEASHILVTPRLAFQSLTVVIGYGIEHASLQTSDGLIRLDVVEGTLLGGPVALSASLEFGRNASIQCGSLARLMRHLGLTGAGYWRVPRDYRLPRLVEALRVSDAVAEGASLREIALALRGERYGFVEWPGQGDSTKSWVRRRVALARRLRSAGPTGVFKRAI